MKSLTTPDSQPHDPALIIGMAPLVRLAYENGNIAAVWKRLLDRIKADPEDAAALIDMSVILQVTGQREKGLTLQKAALDLRRVYHRRHGRADGLRVVAIVTEGDFMANTPIDFLLEGSNVDLWLAFVGPEAPDLANLPDHDLLFLAVGESQENRPVLDRLEPILSAWKGPIMNGPPHRIRALARPEVAQMFAREPSILAPSTIPVDREALQRLGNGRIEIGALLLGSAFPITARPLDSHAGKGLQRIDRAEDIDAYLRSQPDDRFYLAPFIDYSGPDGLFRKQRVAVIDGRPYAVHQATSEHWIVHYLSADMTGNAARRAEEAAWMRDFDSEFAVRHAAAFDALHRKIGLSYFVIDCAEMADGRLLLFEADVAMIVHAMDSEATFPYKKPVMRKLFDAFHGALLHCREQSLPPATPSLGHANHL